MGVHERCANQKIYVFQEIEDRTSQKLESKLRAQTGKAAEIKCRQQPIRNVSD